MNRGTTHPLVLALLSAAVLTAGACSAGDAKAKEQTSSPPVVQVAAVAAAEQPIVRFIRATGSLMAEEQADVAAETAGRVVAANIERGSAVSQGAELIRISSTARCRGSAASTSASPSPGIGSSTSSKRCRHASTPASCQRP